MIEHYLTVCQLKKVYAKPSDNTLSVISDALHPIDAAEIGLEPIISVMLTVARHGIHYQEIYLKSDPICLIGFLARAWNYNKVGGLPHVLTTSPQLNDFYDVEGALREIDEDCTIAFKTARDQSIAASMRYAQENPTAFIQFNRLKSPLGTPLSEVIRASSQAINSYTSYSERETPVKGASVNKRVMDLASKITQPVVFDSRVTARWIDLSAKKSKRLTKDQGVLLQEDRYAAVNYYTIGLRPHEIARRLEANQIPVWENAVDADLSFLNDMDEELAVLDCMAKDYEKDFESILPLHQLNDLKKNGIPIKYSTHLELLEKMKSEPGVYFPKTAKQFRHVFDFLEYRCPECIFELTGNGRQPWPFRVFAVLDENEETNLVAVDKKYTFKAVPDMNAVEFSGQLNIGAAGMAVVMHSLSNLKHYASMTLSVHYSEIVGAMLGEFGVGD